MDKQYSNLLRRHYKVVRTEEKYFYKIENLTLTLK